MLKNKILIALCFMVLCGCSAVKAPQGSVPRRKDIVTDAFGGWISASLKTTRNSIQGEFIAISLDSVFIMSDNKVQILPKADIDNARIILFNSESGAYSGWTFLSSLATISNGHFLVFTLPINLITGISTASGEAKRINYYDYPALTWDELNKYARFPQGIPEQVDTKEIKPRPITHHR
jgi:hypothetical protein